MGRLVFALFALPVVVACSPTSPLAEVEVVTDRPRYQVGDPVVVEIRNHSDNDAWFFHCDHRPSGLQQRAGKGHSWEMYMPSGGYACPSIFEAGVVPVTPGSAWRFTFAREASSAATLPRGEFRFVFETGVRSRGIGEQRIYSNVFTVE